MTARSICRGGRSSSGACRCRRRRSATFDSELAEVFFEALRARVARLNLHLACIAARTCTTSSRSRFKAFARALRQAVEIDPRAIGARPPRESSDGRDARRPRSDPGDRFARRQGRAPAPGPLRRRNRLPAKRRRCSLPAGRSASGDCTSSTSRARAAAAPFRARRWRWSCARSRAGPGRRRRPIARQQSMLTWSSEPNASCSEPRRSRIPSSSRRAARGVPGPDHRRGRRQERLRRERRLARSVGAPRRRCGPGLLELADRGGALHGHRPRRNGGRAEHGRHGAPRARDVGAGHRERRRGHTRAPARPRPLRARHEGPEHRRRHRRARAARRSASRWNSRATAVAALGGRRPKLSARRATCACCPARLRERSGDAPSTARTSSSISTAAASSCRTTASSKAKEELERALRMQPRDVEGQGLLGVVYFRLGMYPRAIEISERLSRDLSGRGHPQGSTSRSVTSRRASQAARDMLEEVIRASPITPEPGAISGSCFERLGEVQNAPQAAFEHAGQPHLARRMQRLLEESRLTSPRAATRRATRCAARPRMRSGARMHPRDLPFLHAEAQPGRTTTPGRWRAVEPGTRSLPPLDVDLRSWAASALPFRSVPEPAEHRVAGSPGIDARGRGPVAATASIVAERPSSPRGAGRSAPRARLPDGRGRTPDGLVFITLQDEFAVRTERLRALSPHGQGIKPSPLKRRLRGRDSDEPFGGTGSTWTLLEGAGLLLLEPRGIASSRSVELGGEFMYLRETRLVGFDGSSRYENGRLPAAEPAPVPMVQFAGRGVLVVEAHHALRALAVTADCPLTVKLLPSWAGRDACSLRRRRPPSRPRTARASSSSTATAPCWWTTRDGALGRPRLGDRARGRTPSPPSLSEGRRAQPAQPAHVRRASRSSRSCSCCSTAARRRIACGRRSSTPRRRITDLLDGYLARQDERRQRAREIPRSARRQAARDGVAHLHGADGPHPRVGRGAAPGARDRRHRRCAASPAARASSSRPATTARARRRCRWSASCA